MRLTAALLAALLLALPCAGSLPATCAPAPVATAAGPCCPAPGSGCGGVQADAYCCPTQSAPAPASAERSLPAPSPAPELVLLGSPAPVPALQITLLPSMSPVGLPRPALYLLHHSFRS